MVGAQDLAQRRPTPAAVQERIWAGSRVDQPAIERVQFLNHHASSYVVSLMPLERYYRSTNITSIVEGTFSRSFLCLDHDIAKARERQRDKYRKAERQADIKRRAEEMCRYEANQEWQELIRQAHQATMLAFISLLGLATAIQ
ncbi:hypothetical protein PtA15_8A357 [Puccinia triticina]|uniref:Uncharacterized protein n=1 Tax=Puccinia triticina TaxID=208348 RepID=A0ABY7CR87_9BASI|nr:uncharacterized protein PtA15_8A357 [Puccinia triticina]WAQ87453.1 hypothetical protein PtA15_8A357 [Puccinia triticina]